MNKVKIILLEIYNTFIPYILGLLSFYSIFKHDLKWCLLLIINTILMLFIAFKNSNLIHTYKWNKDDIKLMDLEIIKELLEDKKIKEKYNKIQTRVEQKRKYEKLLQKYK